MTTSAMCNYKAHAQPEILPSPQYYDIVSVCVFSFLFSLSVRFFFSFFKKALSQGRRHVHLTLDISLSSRVYTFILIERLQIACYRPVLITDSFVQIRDVFQPASPAFIYNILNSSRKGSKLLSCKFVFCLFIGSLSMRYVILSIHYSKVRYFIALMSSLSCSRRVRS